MLLNMLIMSKVKLKFIILCNVNSVVKQQCRFGPTLQYDGGNNLELLIS